MFNLFSWVTDLVETFTFYGGGKGGSSSSSTATDFFGVGKRAPFADLLGTLLLGGTIGGTQGHYTNGGSGSNDPNGGHWASSNNGFGLPNRVWVPNSRGNGRGAGNQGAYVPGTPGMSIADYIKQTPGYQFGMDQGQQAIERSFSARGFGPSGYENLALQNYGNQYAGQQYQQTISNLMNPAGTNLIGQNSQSSTQGSSALGGILGAASAMFNPFGAAASAGGLLTGSTGMQYGSIMTGPNSDRKLKTNIKHINTINGIKIYSFNYIWSYLKSIGVMAQDLLEMPEYKHAVGMNSMGYTVDYSKLPI